MALAQGDDPPFNPWIDLVRAGFGPAPVLSGERGQAALFIALSRVRRVGSFGLDLARDGASLNAVPCRAIIAVPSWVSVRNLRNTSTSHILSVRPDYLDGIEQGELLCPKSRRRTPQDRLRAGQQLWHRNRANGCKSA